MRKILKKLHLYFALILFIPLVLQGLTGTILVFRNEISDVILRQKYLLSKGEIVDEALIIEEGKRVSKEKLSEEFVFSGVKISAVAKLRFSKNGEKKEWAEILLDPVSLQFLEIANPNQNFFRVIKIFHESLLLQNVKFGKNIVGIFGIVMLFMCVSGLVIWWPKPGFLKHALKFKFSSTGKKFHRDLHGSVGFWMLIPLTASSITGIYLIYFRSKESSKLWHAIHEGTFAGLFGQLIVFLTGFLPLLFSITGVALWWIKKRDKKSKISAKI